MGHPLSGPGAAGGRRGRDPAHRRRPGLRHPPSIVDEAGRSLRRGRTRYGPTAGDPPLREAIARHHEKTTGQRVSADEVVVFAGAQSALFACVLCIADPGDEVAVFEPRYVTYDGVIDTPGAVRVDVPLAAAQGFRFDPDALGRAVTPRTCAVLLNTPHNPTGLVARPRGAGGHRRDRETPRSLGAERRGLREPHLRCRARGDREPARHGRTHGDDQLALEVARHAGVAPRLGGGAAVARAPSHPSDRVDGLRGLRRSRRTRRGSPSPASLRRWRRWSGRTGRAAISSAPV